MLGLVVAVDDDFGDIDGQIVIYRLGSLGLGWIDRRDRRVGCGRIVRQVKISRKVYIILINL